MKSDREAELNYIELILNEIITKFVQKFSGHFTLQIDDKIELLNSFKDDVKEIIKQKSNIEEFFETMEKT